MKVRPIDANALKTHVCDMCDDGQRECKGDESCAILCWINDMPTIEPEVQHGRWIAQEDADGDISFVCSKCRRRLRWAEDFCPSCGTRMDVANTNVDGIGGADNE